VRNKEESPTPRDSDGRIDKKKLLAIAKRNASAMLQLGTMQRMRAFSADELAAFKSGGKSVDELVGMCVCVCVFNCLCFQIIARSYQNVISVQQIQMHQM
jgi:hypothetical protein